MTTPKRPKTKVEAPSGNVYRIKIIHNHEPKDPALCAITTATIYGKRGRILGRGEAKCHAKDQFVRHEGVKRSLARALENANEFGASLGEYIGKSDRASIWAKVWNGKYSPAQSARERAIAMLTGS